MPRKEPKKRGNPTGRRIKPQLISQAFKLFCDNVSMCQIAKQLGVCDNTIRKYRDSDNWIERREIAKQKIIERVDAQVVSSQSRQLSYAREMQSKGINRIKNISDTKIPAKDAIAMVVHGIKLEREIAGEGERAINISIKLPNDLEDL